MQQPPGHGYLECKQAQQRSQDGLRALMEVARGVVHVPARQRQHGACQHEACRFSHELA